MNACDHRFALNYVYPLAQAAYDEPWNAAANPVLANLTQVGEIRIDASSQSFLVAMAAAPSPGAQGLLSSMMKPKGAGSITTANTVADAERLTIARADSDAPTQTSAASTVSQAGMPVAPDVAASLDNRFGWVCIDPSCGRLIVAFRGTQTAGDWLDDLDFVSEAYRPIAGGGTVHQGFQHVYYAVRDNVLRLVREHCGSIREVLVTGHSLGAALAALALPDIVNVLRGQSGVPSDLKITLYNLASPRVGHADFKSFFNARFSCWRIANTWDLVPNVPPELAGYAHVGAQFTIDSGFSLSIAHNHVLETGYLPGLETWNHEHPGEAVAASAQTRGRYVPPGISD
jgi:hypothetical protein